MQSDKSVPKLTIDYVLDGTGWATAVWDHGTRVEMTASYLHDSLDELAESVLVLRRSSEMKVSFFDEPGEHQVVLHREGEVLSYSIRWFHDWVEWGLCSPDRFRVVAEGTVLFARYSQQVSSVLYRLLREHGEDGYRSKWVEHPFPIDKYKVVVGGSDGDA
ncbi:MAG: hypothetical protein AAF184_12490 [Pseudomonadota bacterium]